MGPLVIYNMMLAMMRCCWEEVASCGSRRVWRTLVLVLVRWRAVKDEAIGRSLLTYHLGYLKRYL